MESIIIYLALVCTLTYLGIFIYINPRITPITVFLLYIFPIVLGYFAMDSLYHTAFSMEIVASIAVFFLGTKLNKITIPTNITIKLPELLLSSTQIKLIAVIVFFFSFYHIYALGFPLFKDSVEIDRFNFTDSGFWGIPSRFFLNILPLTIMFLTHQWLHDSKNKKYLIISWIAFLGLNLLSGFKGSILVAILIGVFTLSVTGKLKMREAFNPRFILLGLLGLFAASAISFLYKTREISSFTQSLFYIYSRATVGGAEAGYIIMKNDKQFEKSNFINNDFQYYARKYTKRPIPLGVNPSDKVVSSFMTGTPLNDNYFVVSVTTGLFPILKSDYGLWLTLFIHIALGFIFGILAQWVIYLFRNRIFVYSSIVTYFMYVTMIAIGNGGPIYWLINSIVSVIIFLTICMACSVIGGKYESIVRHSTIR